jgi:hypothetical protein
MHVMLVLKSFGYVDRQVPCEGRYAPQNLLHFELEMHIPLATVPCLQSRASITWMPRGCSQGTGAAAARA